MRRIPNPWVVLPVTIAAIAGGFVGFFVTDASCGPDSCTLAALLVAVGVALAAAAGVGVVVVLALRSLAEWKEHEEREILTRRDGDEPPTPPAC